MAMLIEWPYRSFSGYCCREKSIILEARRFFVIKQSIRLVGCIIALFALILVFKHSHLMQEEKPLNTTEDLT
ncbi:MAG: hypothetical protein ACLTXL_12505 [Clostridia bacterium]